MILHPRSAAVLPTDALGARAIRLFVLGQSADAIGKWLERQCPGAEKRWRRMVEALYDRGAVSIEAPNRTLPWWLRRLAAVLLGPVLSALTAMLRAMPVRVLLELYERLPASPLGARTRDHLLPFIEANLCAAGYADRSPAWRRAVARQVSAATLRTHFISYLMLILPARKVSRLVQRLTAVRGMERLLQAHKEHDGAIVVGLHWELFFAPIIYAGSARPVTVLADLGMAEYSVGADREPPASPFNDRVDSAARMAAKTLAHRLRASQIVMLAFDVAPPAHARGAAVPSVCFLGHPVTRFDTAAWLATHTGKPILLVSTYREGRRLIVDFSAPLMPAPDLKPSERIAHLTAQVYEAAERLIRRHPEAWLVWSCLHTLTVPAPRAAPP